MAVYTPESLGIKPPPNGFQQGAWYGSRQYWNGTLSDPNVIHPESNQPGAGAPVSPEVVAQSAKQQGKTPQQFESFFEQERQRAAKLQPTPAAPSAPVVTPTATTPSTPGGAGAGATGAGLITQPQTSFNLPQLYSTLYKSSGISQLESDLAEKERIFTETKAKINDNPYLSEATRVGRVRKLEEAHTNRTANLRGEIATKKADVEMQLNLQTKQFDINSQIAKDALNQFNTLLQMGALSGASGEDVANITRATGISSSMIQSAIKAQSAKNVKTVVKEFTNKVTGEVTIAVIDENTGAIIKTTSLGRIGETFKAEEPKEPKAQTEAEQKTSAYLDVQKYLQNKNLQAQISPEDLYNRLLAAYPLAFDYIKKEWSPRKIRLAWGEKEPYGKK